MGEGLLPEVLLRALHDHGLVRRPHDVELERLGHVREKEPEDGDAHRRDDQEADDKGHLSGIAGVQHREV